MLSKMFFAKMCFAASSGAVLNGAASSLPGMVDETGVSSEVAKFLDTPDVARLQEVLGRID